MTAQPCRHHWTMPTWGRKVKAVCRKCGEKQTFINELDEAMKAKSMKYRKGNNHTLLW